MATPTTSRDTILKAMRANAPQLRPLPDPPQAIVYPNPLEHFAATLAGVGGRFLKATDEADLQLQLGSLEVFQRATRIASTVPSLPGNVDLEALKNPHELEGIDLAILPGDFAVAENGAVWVPGTNLGPQRAIFVIAQHLVLVIQASTVVHNMQQAYENLNLQRPGFGVFISGPSKTADIEQSLVIGAHGARSCTVIAL
ncbi:LutC/YkgG family protein [Paludibaculum fermentans]|uniref:LUD domain-containing protein n=1 Tax=Paludibaculum fermentans TaxID=1473598 RepID=A0A7S7NSU1_PALFE|nr:LUD domain-containing protein [Paludibaculum fermentans]QOY89192.1 LUD domain-containing protein [Paludibaculum fermentans]